MRVDLLGQLTDYLIHILHTSLDLTSGKFFMGHLKSFYLLLYVLPNVYGFFDAILKRRQQNQLEDVTIRLHCGSRSLQFGQRIDNSTQRPLCTRTRMPSFQLSRFVLDPCVYYYILHTVASASVSFILFFVVNYPERDQRLERRPR
ncbi:hypothetical protein JB92DRAFT_2985226 [Gautieria morchelliformis]|nr:hypothetical protein JB92DRAFT_2985226 [Gautieria morchelliformis]